jgi:hypothetical protein
LTAPGLLDVAVGGAHGLIGESLQPQDPREDHARDQPLVVLKADRVRPARRRNVAAQHVLEAPPRVRLIAQIVQRRADHPLTDVEVRGVLRALAEAFGQLQGAATLAAADVTEPETPEGPQLVLGVTEALVDLERGRPGRDGVRGRSAGVHQRQPERGAQLHLATRIAARPGAEGAERPLKAMAAFDHGRLAKP